MDEYYNDKLTLNTADAVVVTAPTDVTGISAALAKGGFISGRVTAADTGAGLPYIEVTVYDASGEPVGYGYTESDGRYRVSTGLATGSYRVGFTDDSGQGLARAGQVANEGLLNPEIAAQPTPDAGTTGEPEVSLSPTLELRRIRPQSVGIAEGGVSSGYLPMFYNNKRTLAEADLVSVIALNETTDINATLLRGIFLPLIHR